MEVGFDFQTTLVRSYRFFLFHRVEIPEDLVRRFCFGILGGSSNETKVLLRFFCVRTLEGEKVLMIRSLMLYPSAVFLSRSSSTLCVPSKKNPANHAS